MAVIRPFECVRPQAEKQSGWQHFRMMYTTEKKRAGKLPASRFHFKIDRAETQFDSSVDTYAPEVYAKAKELLETLLQTVHLSKTASRHIIFMNLQWMAECRPDLWHVLQLMTTNPM